MEFTRFQSLLNENPKNSLGVLRKCAQFQAIKTEKIHGANFSVYINSDGMVRFGSRNQYLCRDSNFFNFQRFFTEERIESLVEKSKNALDDGFTIRIFGELFGGHDAVGIKPVQKEIRYDGDIQFRVFHVEMIHVDGEIMDYDWDDVVSTAKWLDLPLVPVISEGPLADLYAEEIEVPSVLSSSKAIAEGFCYRLRNNHEGKPVILKRRTTEFCETKGKIRDGKLVEKTFDPEVLVVLNKVREMVTSQRVSNVNSHHGFIGMPCFKDLHNYVMEDIQKDAASDLGIDEDAFKAVKKEIGREIIPFIKEELTK